VCVGDGGACCSRVASWSASASARYSPFPWSSESARCAAVSDSLIRPSACNAAALRPHPLAHSGFSAMAQSASCSASVNRSVLMKQSERLECARCAMTLLPSASRAANTSPLSLAQNRYIRYCNTAPVHVIECLLLEREHAPLPLTIDHSALLFGINRPCTTRLS
jgi:hypothetical protein